MAVKSPRTSRKAPPIDEAALEQLALSYAARFATSEARLAAYLHRKLAGRGWAGAGEPPIRSIVGRMAALGYVDDRAFARARASSLTRRGYGERRIGQALRAVGIEEELSQEVREESRARALEAALLFARRRRIGPFAPEAADRDGREKAIGALVRAGHSLDLARRIAECGPGEVPEPDAD